MCEQLAQGRYLTVARPGVELATSRVASQRHNRHTTRPHVKGGRHPFSLGKLVDEEMVRPVGDVHWLGVVAVILQNMVPVEILSLSSGQLLILSTLHLLLVKFDTQFE